ncbi:geranylgeranylglyceryl/heptaprenylglyceryl phosphate synthase [bacterium]|nr:MAG: geranylgeranylglyceryl/heptaprenylglyceryl phosphate synthase [bacterium]
MDFIEKLSVKFEWHRKKSMFWLLIDPDRIENLNRVVENAEKSGVDAILVGSSILVKNPVEQIVSKIKNISNIPVIIFPGGCNQLSSDADAILLLSFLSSRNPRWLIEEHILAAHIIKRMNVPVIPTGYLHIESGAMTSVGFFAGSPPLPRNKPDITVAYSLAAQFLGMHSIFLEAGSGAQFPVPVDIVAEVAKATRLFVMVGGGIRNIEQAAERAKFADAVVIGNFFENKNRLDDMKIFADAIHNAR